MALVITQNLFKFITCLEYAAWTSNALREVKAQEVLLKLGVLNSGWGAEEPTKIYKVTPTLFIVRHYVVTLR